MGTRGAITFAARGEEFTTYNHYDSYPKSLGLAMLEFAGKVAADPQGYAERIGGLTIVSAATEPTNMQREALAEFTDEGVSTGRDWYATLRRTQGDPEAILRSGFLIDGSLFPLDSLFCEWAYAVDIDAGRLEVYQGYQKEPHDEGRFADGECRDGYYPVRLVASWPLDNLPDEAEFLAELAEDEED